MNHEIEITEEIIFAFNTVPAGPPAPPSHNFAKFRFAEFGADLADTVSKVSKCAVFRSSFTEFAYCCNLLGADSQHKRRSGNSLFYAWRRFYLSATCHLFDSDDTEVKLETDPGTKALGKFKFLWDWEDSCGDEPVRDAVPFYCLPLWTVKMSRRYEVRTGEPLSVTARMTWVVPTGHAAGLGSHWGLQATVGVTTAFAESAPVIVTAARFPSAEPASG